MAKQKTHEQLGITMGELIALQGVRSMLAGGILKYHKYHHNYKEKAHTFNMSCPLIKNDHCGSIGCIGGYMSMALGEDPKDYVSRHDPLDPGLFLDAKRQNLGKLFYPPDRLSYSKITIKQAIKAIDNFLTKGKPLWNKVPGMKEDKGWD